MAAVSEAMKRISDSWQAGSRRADQPLQPQPHDSEAAQVLRAPYLAGSDRLLYPASPGALFNWHCDPSPIRRTACSELQIESRMLEHLCSGAPAEQVVQQLRAGSEDTLATDAALQVRKEV